MYFKKKKESERGKNNIILLKEKTLTSKKKKWGKNGKKKKVPEKFALNCRKNEIHVEKMNYNYIFQDVQDCPNVHVVLHLPPLIIITIIIIESKLYRIHIAIYKYINKKEISIYIPNDPLDWISTLNTSIL